MGERRSTTLVLSPTLNFTLTLLIRRCTRLSISVLDSPRSQSANPSGLGPETAHCQVSFKKSERAGGLTTVSGKFIMRLINSKRQIGRLINSKRKIHHEVVELMQLGVQLRFSVQQIAIILEQFQDDGGSESCGAALDKTNDEVGEHATCASGVGQGDDHHCRGD